MQNNSKDVQTEKDSVQNDSPCCSDSCCGSTVEFVIPTKTDEIKRMVNEKYSKIAEQAGENDCCGSSCCAPENGDYTIMKDEYDSIEGHIPDADLGLGCGLPTQYAGINSGDTVVDLGSGAGNDAFVARRIVGEDGTVIGVDFTETMIQRANTIKEKHGFTNVEFRFGDIEAIPVADEVVDVVVSNCVLNLVPNKAQVFSEIKRILKPGGHFSISDIVVEGVMSKELQDSAAMYAGCISGAIPRAEYLGIIESAGFTRIEVKKSKKITLPEEMLHRYLSPDGLKDYHENIAGIFSITVNGYKQ